MDIMVRIEDIIEAYKVTRSNKRRAKDSVAFEVHCERNLLRLYRDINDHTLAPSAYTFVATQPKPREVFACDFATRVVHHYLDIRLRPLIEKELTNRTFNNRVGYGINKAVNTHLSDIYEVSNGFTTDCWVIAADIKGYFPNADQDVVYKQLSKLIEGKYRGEDKDDLHYMLLRSVYSYPTKDCEVRSPLSKWSLIPKDKSLFFKPEGIGGVIGHLFWQNAMNYYLADFDRYMQDSGFHYVRFVDDMRWVTANKEDMLALFPTFRQMLSDVGCVFNEGKFQCQHYTKGGKFLSTPYKLDRVYVSKRVARRASAMVYDLNHRVSIRRIDTFLSSINSYLGIMKTRNGYGLLRDLIDEISPKWWRYVTYDDGEKKIVALPEYSLFNRTKNRYNIKFTRRYEYKKRKAQQSLHRAA